MRPPVSDKWLIFLGSLFINALAAILVLRPDYMDAYYYFTGALQLAQGRGFTEPYVWNYLAPLGPLPVPSHLYWMPLTSLVAAPFIAVAQALGPTLTTDQLFKAAQIPFCLAGAALPVLAYTIAWRTTQVRRHAWLAAGLTLFSSFYFLYWATTDAFALFALAGAGALVAAARAATTNAPRWWFIAGLGAGCAHLARADGPLLLGVLAVWGLWASGSGCALRRWSALGLGYFALMGVWFLRNWLAVGTPLAPGSAQTLWLLTYDDLFSYPASLLTPARYFAAGLDPILQSRWEALQLNLGTLLGAQTGVFALPFVLIGFWQLRRQWLFQAAAFYALSLFLAMTLIFPYPGARGGYLHSGAALLPFFYAAFGVGLDAALAWVARYRRHWQLARVQQVFSLFSLLLAVGIALSLFILRYQPFTPRPPEVYAQIGAWLAEAEPTPHIVVVNNPPGFYYHTRRPAIVIPNGEATTLAQVTHDFGARWVVLDVNHPTGLAPLYSQPSHAPHLQLRATFFDAAQQPIYLFEVVP